jgi:cytochrome c553
MRSLLARAKRHPLRAGLVAIALAVLLTLIALSSGLVSVSARAGHWAITEWVLHFTMRRSVITHSLMIDPPTDRLDDPAMILRGAGHYETGCRPCHGAPGTGLPPVPQAMTPPPPALAVRVSAWRPRELFYIIKHGVKMTGMPAWPAPGRDDEIWPVVAFLRQLPTMDGDRYRELALGAHPADAASDDGAPPRVVVAHCARCHGADGTGRLPDAFPVIAGQRADYLQRALDAYATGARRSGIMQPVAALLQPSDRAAAARYYAALPRPTSTTGEPRDLEAITRGAQLVHEGNPRRAVPACADCHLPGGARVNDAYPLLTGLSARDITQQLHLLKSRARGGSEYVSLMHEFVDALDSQDITDVAAFFAGGALLEPTHQSGR